MTDKPENTETNTNHLPNSGENNKAALQSRRHVLSTIAAGVGTTAIAGCLGGGGGENGEPTASSPLRVEFFGGIFKEILDEQLVEPFHEETGIPIESEAGLSQYQLTRLNSAVQAGEAPVDLFVAQPRAPLVFS